jgi:hypothetical protein
MSVREILDSDTLNQGFREKYNETILEIILSGFDDGDGNLILLKNSGIQVVIDLKDSFYTKTEINAKFSGTPFTYQQSDLTDNGDGTYFKIFAHTYNTITPDVTIFDNTGRRQVEINVMVDIVDASHVKITHIGEITGIYNMKIRE